MPTARPDSSKRPTQADFVELYTSTRSDLAALAHKLHQGKLSAQEWYSWFSSILLERHADSWILGRRLSGDDSRPSIEDELVGRAKADSESQWLLTFLEKIEAGGYLDGEGKLRLSPIVSRSMLYAGKIRGTANDALINTSEDSAQFEWRLGGVEKHCSDCPTFAAMSPWAKDELGVWPGGGDTPCLGNCKCSIVRISDGVRGFDPA